MSKRTVKLTESELKKVITESVKKILRESYGEESDFYYNLQDEMSSIENEVFARYSAINQSSRRYENVTYTSEQLCGAVEMAVNLMFKAACNLHDNKPVGYQPSHDGDGDYKTW